MTKRDAYVAKIKLQIDELNAMISALEAKAHDVRVGTHAQYKEEIKKLRHQSKLAEDKFDELKASGEDAWESMVDEMEKVRDAFKHSFNYFKSQL